jgi:hypothetical protein
MYANVFATVPQLIGPYSSPTDTVVFDSQNAVSGSGIIVQPPQQIMTAAWAALAAAASSASVIAFSGSPAQAAAASAAVVASAGQSFFSGSLAATAAVLAAGGTVAVSNAAGAAVVLESSGVGPTVTSDFDMSMASVNGSIKFLKHAVYHLAWQLQARITAPVPNPVPSWSFGFWLDNVLLPGSVYSGFTQAPGDDACHSTGDLQVEVKAGQVLKLRNTSVSAVNLNPNVTGSVFPITIASVNIECLQALA